MSKKTVIRCDCCGLEIIDLTSVGSVSVFKLDRNMHICESFDIEDMCDKCYNHIKTLIKSEKERINRTGNVAIENSDTYSFSLGEK
jgi:hypothetical protein